MFFSLPWVTQAAICVLVAVAIYGLVLVRSELKIRRLGGHAPVRRTRLPFGIDYILEIVKYAESDMSLEFWDKNFRQFGNRNNPYTLEATIGARRVITTADPENIKAILATQFNDYGKGEYFNKVWHEFLGDSELFIDRTGSIPRQRCSRLRLGIFSTDHQKWHDSRQLIRPQFIKDRVSDLGIFEEHANILISQIREGQPVDMKDLFFRYVQASRWPSSSHS